MSDAPGGPTAPVAPPAQPKSTGGGTNPFAPPTSRPSFWKRKGALITGVVALLIAVSVVTDLPQSPSPASKRSDVIATIKEVSTDVAGCNAALGEAFTIYHQQAAGILTRAHRSEAPAILADDANGCSYTSQSIVDLASIDISQAGIGKTLNHLAGHALNWTDPDGLTAIYDISTLLHHPHQARARRDLAHQVALLTADRNAELAAEHSLAAQVGGGLPSIGLRPIRA